MRSILAATTILALVAAPVLAQQPGMGMGQGGMMGGGMQMRGGDQPMGPLTSLFGKYAPAAVLAMKDHLSLTGEQEAKLTALVEAEKAAVTAAHHPAHAAHMELRKLEGAEAPDTAAMRPFFLAHHGAEGNMQWIRVTFAIQAKALLTAAQRSHVEQMGGGAGHH